MTERSKSQGKLAVINKELAVKLRVPNKELELYNASKSLPPLKDFVSDSEKFYIIKELTKWATLTGKLDEVTDEEFELCTNFMIRNFPNLNIVDVNQAYSMVINGELENNIYHGDFAPLYIAKVLNLYISKYRKDLFWKIKTGLKRIELEKPAPAPELSERIKTFKELLKIAWETVNLDQETYLDFGDGIYDYIKDNKLIRFNKIIKDLANKYADKEINADKKKKTVTSVLKKRAFQKLDKNTLRLKKQKEYIVNQWLKNMSKEDLQNELDNLKKI